MQQFSFSSNYSNSILFVSSDSFDTVLVKVDVSIIDLTLDRYFSSFSVTVRCESSLWSLALPSFGSPPPCWKLLFSCSSSCIRMSMWLSAAGALSTDPSTVLFESACWGLSPSTIYLLSSVKRTASDAIMILLLSAPLRSCSYWSWSEWSSSSSSSLLLFWIMISLSTILINCYNFLLN